jgi:hypothetical protein
MQDYHAVPRGLAMRQVDSGGGNGIIRCRDAHDTTACLDGINAVEQVLPRVPQVAVDVYVHRIRQTVGAMAATLGGVDWNEFPGFIAPPGADRDNLAFLRLLLSGVRDDDAALGLVFGSDALDDHTVVQGTKLGFSHNLYPLDARTSVSC